MTTFDDFRQFILGQAFGSTRIPQGADLSGKTVVVTGANCGLGFECAKHLARLNVEKLILACRNLDKGNAARTAILKATNANASTVEVWQVDLANHKSVLSFAKRVQTQLPRLDAFISNAGIEPVIYGEAEGLEATVTVNLLSTMLLNVLVLPKLRETSTKYGSSATLTTVGSSVHIFGNANELQASPDNKAADTFARLSDPVTANMGGPDAQMSPRYALVKLMLHAVLQRLAAKASRPGQKEHVIVNWVNPGWCASEIGRDKAKSWGQNISFALLGRTTEQGSRELVNGIFAGQDSHGHYMSECCVKPESTFLRSEQGERLREQLWKELIARLEKITPETSTILA